MSSFTIVPVTVLFCCILNKPCSLTQEESGRQFDPRLVPVLVRCVRDGTIETR